MVPKMSPTAKPGISIFVLGATHFDKISAVEGLAPHLTMLQAFHDMDRQGLSSDERVCFLKAKYGRMPAAIPDPTVDEVG